MKTFSKQLIIIFVFLLSGIAGFMVSRQVHKNTNPAPVASDVQVIPTFHYPAIFVQQLAGDPEAGKKIFMEFCASCHNPQPIINVNAPHIGDRQAWHARRQLGMPVLLKVTISGVGAMPARGGCFECSDEQLQATINYILQQSK